MEVVAATLCRYAHRLIDRTTGKAFSADELATDADSPVKQAIDSADTISTNTSTTLTGLLKGDGSTVSAAVAGTDYATAVSHLTGDSDDLTTTTSNRFVTQAEKDQIGTNESAITAINLTLSSLGSAAFVAVVYGGNGASDAGKALAFGVTGDIELSRQITIHNTGGGSTVITEAAPDAGTMTLYWPYGSLTPGYIALTSQSNGTITDADLTAAPVTVASLPAAGTAGRRRFVTDANATTFASVVAGSGANAVPVYDDGTNWRIG